MQQKLLQAFFLQNLRFFFKKGSKGLKKEILQETRNFYFSSDFDGFFFSLFLSMRAFGSMTMDFLYLVPFFELKGVKVVGGWGSQFLLIWKNFIFNLILTGFSANDSS